MDVYTKDKLTPFSAQTQLPPYIRKGSDLHADGPENIRYNLMRPARERAGPGRKRYGARGLT